MPQSTKSRSKKSKPAGKKVAPRPLSPSSVPQAVGRMSQWKSTARFAAGRQVIATAEKSPDRVYPQFDAIASLLDGPCTIIRWNALRILSHLAAVDSAGKIPAFLDKYLGYIRDGSLITAGTAIAGAGRILASRPDLLDRILPALLNVETATFPTPKCRHVAMGHTLDALAANWPAVHTHPAVQALVRRHLKNPRPAVARRAARLSGKAGPPLC
jgi:hypothetical protein